ncbi:hypothetical protein TNCV_4824811 [Trichonephila clavipes]|uniref:Uncharacterized protein n=1 Tax=Trichonephila clavipes TaxID=2585209 RepID=A0A8X6RIZ1_TRICX|nr:hypothetical protein TNCV_4824811 [Trichonephila clavipes]
MLTTPANGQYGAVWSMDTTTLRAYSPPPLKRLATVFRRSAFVRQQRTDLPPAELWCACSFFADRTIYLSSAGVVLTTSPVLLPHSSSFK